MGLLNLFGNDGPTYKTVELDAGTKQLIDQKQQRALASNQEVANELNAGVREAGEQALQTTEQVNERAAQTGEDPGMLKAIQNQYRKVADDSIGRVVRANENNASMIRAQRLESAAKAALAKQNVETQNYSNLMNAMNQAEMARAQLLSSIFSTGGMAAGMFMANRKKGPVTESDTINSFNGPQIEDAGYSTGLRGGMIG